MDFSQFFVRFIRNKLKNVVHTLALPASRIAYGKQHKFFTQSKSLKYIKLIYCTLIVVFIVVAYIEHLDGKIKK
jgi:glutamine amidotransferase PdxT